MSWGRKPAKSQRHKHPYRANTNEPGGENITPGNELGDPQQMTGDDEALDLIGALIDLHELGITHIFFER